MAPPRISRPMGNAQSRRPGLSRAPQPNLTSNVNGAQTASRMTLGGKPVAGLPPSQDQFSPQFQMKSNAQASQSLVPFENSYAPLDRIGQQDDYLNPRSQSQRSPAPSAGGNYPTAPIGLTDYQMQQYENARQEAARRDHGQQARQQAPSAGGNAPSYPPSQYDTGGQVERGPYVNDGQSGQMQYAGGPVAGQAQYYRNTALGQYRPPGSSGQQSRLVGSLQPGTNMNDPRFSGLNGYDTFSAQMADPNRLTPDQKLQSAISSARGMNDYDPTNQGGNRFAGSAANAQYEDEYNQWAIAAGTQAEQQRMQGVAADSQERAMDPKSQDRAFAYQNGQGEMVATNRLGQLQEMQSRFPDSNEIALAIAEEKQRGSALGQKQEDQRERRKAASSDGLSDKERRTLGYRNQVANNAGSRGILPTGAADPNRPGFSVGERIARNNQEAGDKSSFRSSETKLRRSAINTANTKELHDAAGRDNSRLPSGQLRLGARVAAKNDIKNLMDPNFSGSSRDIFHGQVIRDVGLTGDPKEDTAMAAVGKIFANGISTPEQAIAFQKYWKAMSRSDANWVKESGNLGNVNSPTVQQIQIMNEMADVPPEEMYNWFEQNRDRLAGSGSTLAPPVNHPVDSAPSYGFGSF